MTAASTLQTLFDGFDAHRDRPAIVWFDGETKQAMTYGVLADSALRLAGGLVAAGVRPRDPVGLYAPNAPAWIVARLALIACGAMATPFDNDLPEEALRQQLADSRCRRVFTVVRHLPTLRAADADIEPILLDDPESGPESAPENGGEGVRSWRDLLAEPLSPLAEQTPDDVVALFYTSGTTGRPKAVPLTHANIGSNLTSILAVGVVQAGDPVLLPLPLHHSYPFIVGMLAPLAAGAAIVLPAGVTGPQLAHALRDAEVAVVVGVPRLYRAIADGIEGRAAARGGMAAAAFRRLLAGSIAARKRFGVDPGRHLFRPVRAQFAPKLRVLASGGAHLDADVGWRLEGLGFTVLSGYGLVETASIASFNPLGRNRLGSAGLPAPGVEIRIQPLDDMGETGEGEVQIRGPNVFSGYRDNPEANAAAFTADGWFRSGDLGRLDADGYLFITGRAKEMIVLAGGKNVAPEEVEKVYAESPYVREVVVLERAEQLVALVVPELEAGGPGRLQDRIRVSFAELSQRLPPYKRLSGFAITRETLPKTQLGKYRRHLLPPIYDRAERGEPPPAAALSAEDEALLAGARAGALWRFLEERFPDRGLSLESNPQLDLGLDSLAWVALGLEIETRLGIRLSEDVVAQAASVRDLLRAAEQAPASGEALDGAAETRLRQDAERWLAPTGPVETALGRPVHGGIGALARLYFGLRNVGAERVPTEGPLILAPNHVSDLDPFMVGAALSHAHLRRMYWGADADRAFGHPVLGRLARVAHLFPVDDRAPGASLDMATEVLRRGNILVWFPEQWRSPDGTLQPFLPGIGHLVARTGAAVVPVLIEGTFESMPRTARLPRPGRVTVTFGSPIAAAALMAEAEEADVHRRVARRVREAVTALRSAPVR